VLDVEGGSHRPGANVIMWERKHHDKSNQLWRFTPDGYIESVGSGLVLDIEGGGTPGAKLIVWSKKPPQDAANQRWRYDPSTETFTSFAGGLVLDVEGASKSPGARVVAWHAKGPHDNHNQRFYLG